MWLFDRRIAELRKKYSFLIKIEDHRDRDVSGRRVGKVLPDATACDANARTLPLRKSENTDVMVEFQRGNGRICVEAMPATKLVAGQLKKKGRHAVIKGDRAGSVVMHLKTDLLDARVHLEGRSTKDGFRVKKGELCAIE